MANPRAITCAYDRFLSYQQKGLTRLRNRLDNVEGSVLKVSGVEESIMKVRFASCAVLLGCLALLPTWAEEKKEPAKKRIGGAFQVKAITGENKGKTLCYV